MADATTPDGHVEGTHAERTATEAELLETLESLAPGDAEEALSKLASGLFPDRSPDISQVTWPENRAANVVERSRQHRDRADAKLRTAELRYQTLIEQIPAVTFNAVLGEGDNEIYVSPHIEALLGFTQKEWLENPFLWFTQLHPDDREVWYREFARGCRTGGPFRAECRFLARDGRTVWVHGEARLVKDELGRPLFLQGVAFDITEHKRAEALLLREAVHATEQQYRDLVEQVGAIFCEASVDRSGFTFVSKGAEAILGYPPDRWIGDPDFFFSRVHPDDRHDVSAAWAGARERRGGTEEIEFRAITADDRILWLHQKVHIHRAQGGDARLLGVIFDVTDRKRAEEILRASEARLKTETEVGRTLHRIGSTLAQQLNLERLVQMATDEATALTAAEFGAFFYNVINEQGEAYTLYTLSGVPREAFAKFPMPRNTEVFAPTFRGEGIVRLDDVTKDPRYGKNAPHHGMPKGHLPVRSYLAVPVVSPSGEVLGGMFFGHSRPGVFSEEHENLAAGIAGWTALAIENARLYTSAERARAAAEAANRAKDEFLATMSHELRTPLNAVLGWTLILRSGGSDEAMRQRALDTIERNARAQAQIIEDLLDVARVVTGKLTLEVGTVDLAALIDSAIDSIHLAVETKRIQLRTSIDRSGWVIAGDANRLHQVISNLLTNAVKFTPPGGRIDVGLERFDGHARITVSDTGQGISPDFLPYVFERFRQADSSTTRTHGGLGLGLAIVRHLIELHGGTVHVDSAGLGRGATFTVEIPVLQDAGAGHSESATAAATAKSQATLPLEGIRVLVVEDEADSRDLLTHVLQQAGAAVTNVGSAADALARIDALRPDVLISDIGLPHQDGYELIRTLRASGSTAATVPAVAVTAYARPEDRERTLAAGFDVHLSKPITPRDFVHVVQRLARK